MHDQIHSVYCQSKEVRLGFLFIYSYYLSTLFTDILHIKTVKFLPNKSKNLLFLQIYLHNAMNEVMKDIHHS